MKTLLFLLVLVFYSPNIIFGYPQKDSTELESNRRKVLLKGKGLSKGGIVRTPITYPVEVFVDNNTLYFNFSSKLSNVVITVVDVSNNEVIYVEAFSESSYKMTIDMKLENARCYEIEILSEHYDLIGSFEL